MPGATPTARENSRPVPNSGRHDEGVSIGHIFQDEVYVPSRLPKVSPKGKLQQAGNQEYGRLYDNATYLWAKEHGLCVICRKQPPVQDRTQCETCNNKTLESARRKRREAQENGLCTLCKKEPPHQGRTRCETRQRKSTVRDLDAL